MEDGWRRWNVTVLKYKKTIMLQGSIDVSYCPHAHNQIPLGAVAAYSGTSFTDRSTAMSFENLLVNCLEHLAALALAH